MKKIVVIILGLRLLIGVPLMILDVIGQTKDVFTIPSNYDKVIVDLSEESRTEKLLFEHELKVPSKVDFFMQSDASGEKTIKVKSESDIVGLAYQEIDFSVGTYTGNTATSPSLIMGAGSYSVYLTSENTDGRIAIGYRETPMDPEEYDRLLKVHKGELNNPPKHYVEIFSSDLTGRISKDEVVYTLNLSTPTNIGFSIYTSAEQGNLSVDIIGQSSNYYGLVHPERFRICDQLETTLQPGKYQFKLTCEHANGQVSIFLKQ